MYSCAPPAQVCLMSAASQPARSGVSWERIEEMLWQSQDLIATARALSATSRDVQEVSRLLLQENADLRDFLLETMLDVWSRREYRQDQAP